MNAPNALRAFEPVILEVSAGKYNRRDVPIYWTPPKEIAHVRDVRLLRLGGDQEVEVGTQRFRGPPHQLVWIMRDDLAAGKTRRYRLEPGKSELKVPSIQCVVGASDVRFRYGGRPILRYNVSLKQPPDGYDQVFQRNGYIHPVWNPSGHVVTNDFPENHRHHHGIWFPWTKTIFEGREVDFWNSGKKEGRVLCTDLNFYTGGSVVAYFESKHKFIDMTAPVGSKVAIIEHWDVRVYAFEDFHLFDLISTQECAGPAPLIIKKYRYGGMGFRGSEEWEGEGDKCLFNTSEGKTRQDGHATTARWCDISGTVEGRPTGVTIMCHPSNFRHPQPMRIHPSEPFFNFAPMQKGEMRIRPGKKYVSRYRYYVHDGAFERHTSERLWRDFAEPPSVRIATSKENAPNTAKP